MTFKVVSEACESKLRAQRPKNFGHVIYNFVTTFQTFVQSMIYDPPLFDAWHFYDPPPFRVHDFCDPPQLFYSPLPSGK